MSSAFSYVVGNFDFVDTVLFIVLIAYCFKGDTSLGSLVLSIGLSGFSFIFEYKF